MALEPSRYSAASIHSPYPGDPSREKRFPRSLRVHRRGFGWSCWFWRRGSTDQRAARSLRRPYWAQRCPGCRRDRDEREIFITAEPWVAPCERLVFIQAGEAGQAGLCARAVESAPKSLMSPFLVRTSFMLRVDYESYESCSTNWPGHSRDHL